MMKLNEKLAHLSQEQLEELIDRYQNGSEKVQDLVTEFGIDTNPGKLVSLFPPIIHEDLFCPYCEDVNLVSKRQGRTTPSYYPQTPCCPECGHQDSERCRCKSCKAQAGFEQKQAELRKREIIETEYRREIEIPSVSEITLRDAVYILSLARHSLTENFQFVEPFDEEEIALAPLYEFQNEIVKHLYAKGLITISPESPVDSFVFDPAETYVDAYYPVKVIWEFLPGLDVRSKRDYLRKLQTIVKSGDWPEGWRSSIPKLWHHIAQYECLEYFLYLLEQRDFRLDKIGEKTHATFQNLLEDFSVSRIFNLSWMAVRDTTDYIVRENISRGHGKNIFIGAIQRKAERAKAEGWELRHSRRDYNCPQTVVSSTFFNLFLEIGDQAFEMVPPEINENEELRSKTL